MITGIKVTNEQSQSLTIELRNPASSGFLILSIDGLGPTKSDISFTDRPAIDGSLFNTARSLSRDIVLRLMYYGTDIQLLREKAEKYFPSKESIDFQVQTTRRTAHTTAYVESNDPDIFAKDSGCVIVLRCPAAYFLDIIPMETSFSSVTNNFEFPFSNESTSAPLLEMSILTLGAMENIIYPGEAPIGLLLNIHAVGAANDVVMTNAITLETLSIDSAKLIELTGFDILEGDDFWISTVIGNKFAILVRDSTTYNILNCLVEPIHWFQLKKGDNIYTFSADTGIENLEFVIYNDIAYKGV